MTDEDRDELIGPLVLSHYRKCGVIPGWKKQQLIDLSILANRTCGELGTMAGLTPDQTRRYMKKDLFPPPVSIHFLVIDKVLKEARYGEPWMPVIPLDLLNKS